MELPEYDDRRSPEVIPFDRFTRHLQRPSSQPSKRWHLRLVNSQQQLHPMLAKRDPDFIRQFFMPAAWVSDHYFRTEVEGIEHTTDRASLIVSTHNASMAMPDIFGFGVAFLRRFGLDAPLYGLGHRIAFRVPVFGDVVVKCGALPATNEAATIALQADAPVLVCPGGDVDSVKPFRDRHKIMFGERRGFIKLALREQVPIVPVVSVGAHETMFFLNDGQKLAKLLRCDKWFRIKSVPFSLSFPFGITIAGLGAVPLPSKIRIRVLPRIELAEAPSAADDPAVVERCFEHVRERMQTALTHLASQRKRIILG